MQKRTENAFEAFVRELEASAPTSDGLTAREIEAALGMSSKSVFKKVLHPAHVAGRLIVTSKVAENIAGVRVQVPAYKVKGK